MPPPLSRLDRGLIVSLNVRMRISPPGGVYFAAIDDDVTDGLREAHAVGIHVQRLEQSSLTVSDVRARGTAAGGFDRLMNAARE